MNKRITTLRGIAIIIIVFGHSIILYSSKWNLYTIDDYYPILDKIKDVINTFQLELFFWLSGFLFYKSLEKSFKIVVCRKFKRIMIPYFIIAFIYMDPIKIFLSTPGFIDIKQIITSICGQLILSGYSLGHLWFLPTLFFIFVLSYILSKRIKENPVNVTLLFIALIICNIGSSLLPNYLQINNIMRYIIYFYMGYLSFRILECNKKIDRHRIFLIISMTLLILCRVFISSIHIIFIFVSFLSLYVLLPNLPNRINTFLQVISENSFGIYLLHSPLIYITYSFFKTWNPMVVIAINFLAFGGLALLMSIYIRQTKFKFILGE